VSDNLLQPDQFSSGSLRAFSKLKSKSANSSLRQNLRHDFGLLRTRQDHDKRMYSEIILPRSRRSAQFLLLASSSGMTVESVAVQCALGQAFRALSSKERRCTMRFKLVLDGRPIFLSLFQLFRRLLPPQFFRYISVHSVQLRVVGTQSHIFPPTSYGMQRPL